MTSSNFPINPKMDRAISDMSKNEHIVKKNFKFLGILRGKNKIFFLLIYMYNRTKGVVLMLGV